MQTITLPKIDIDNSILLSLKESKDELAKKMKLYTAIILYKKNRLSLGKSAQFANMSKLDFIESIKEEGFYLFDYSKSELNEIFQESKNLTKLLK